jgi:hypothetical protein
MNAQCYAESEELDGLGTTSQKSSKKPKILSTFPGQSSTLLAQVNTDAPLFVFYYIFYTLNRRT